MWVMPTQRSFKLPIGTKLQLNVHDRIGTLFESLRFVGKEK